MSTTPHHDADRETLSALFDGELDGDAARFALKRLDHDAPWREACGRWQLAGDALRGQATGVAPIGFADRVGATLAAESAIASAKRSAATAGRLPMRRHWIGGAALAASVAVAALFVTRPLAPDGAPSLPAPQVAAGAQPVAPTADTIATTSPAAPTPDAFSAPPVPAAGTGLAAAMAAADASDRVVERDPRARPDSVPPREINAAASSTAIASIDAAPPAVDSASPHPFLPPGEIASRPWPRATLVHYPTGNAFNVSFDNRVGAAGQPSSSEASPFYPFDPRTLEAQPTPRPATDAPDWP